MLRIILGVIVGYLCVFLLIFTLFSSAYLLMGAERAFQPESYEVSALWLALSCVVSLLAAIAGGWVAATIGKTPAAALSLGVVMLVLGLLMALPLMFADPAELGTRAGDVPNIEAMGKAHQPLWIALVNPWLGLLGAWLGGRLKK